MIKISLLCVGKLKEPYLKEACAEYVKRLGAFCSLTVFETEEERLPEHPSPAQIQAAQAAEGRRLLAKAGRSYGISLCIEGKEMSSPDLSDFLENSASNGFGEFSFFIGGSHGLSEEVKEASRLRLSMSPMTFPHSLARVMVLEQIYRAMEIASGGKYHK